MFREELLGGEAELLHRVFQSLIDLQLRLRAGQLRLVSGIREPAQLGVQRGDLVLALAHCCLPVLQGCISFPAGSFRPIQRVIDALPHPASVCEHRSSGLLRLHPSLLRSFKLLAGGLLLASLAAQPLCSPTGSSRALLGRAQSQAGIHFQCLDLGKSQRSCISFLSGRLLLLSFFVQARDAIRQFLHRGVGCLQPLLRGFRIGLRALQLTAGCRIRLLRCGHMLLPALHCGFVRLHRCPGSGCCGPAF